MKNVLAFMLLSGINWTSFPANNIDDVTKTESLSPAINEVKLKQDLFQDKNNDQNKGPRSKVSLPHSHFVSSQNAPPSKWLLTFKPRSPFPDFLGRRVAMTRQKWLRGRLG